MSRPITKKDKNTQVQAGNKHSNLGQKERQEKKKQKRNTGIKFSS
jgi:hypothetical protein